MAENNDVQTWPDLAIGLYDKLTGRNAKITYDFSNFKVNVPKKAGSSSSKDATEWTLNGKLTISTSES